MLSLIKDSYIDKVLPMKIVRNLLNLPSFVKYIVFLRSILILKVRQQTKKTLSHGRYTFSFQNGMQRTVLENVTDGSRGC